MASIEHRAKFDLVRYASCWEDADILCEALRPGPGGRILSIASAGDNSFALAAEGADVVAADLSPAQLALVELKRAAILSFEHADVLSFLGMRPATNRLSRYRDLRALLPESARKYWDERGDAIAAGPIHGGKFEQYFQLFRKRLLPLVHRRRTVHALLQKRDRAARIAFYDRVWDNRRWRAVFGLFFSRRVMGWLGRDPEFFRYVEGAVSTRILGRVRHAMTELEPDVNPYLEYIVTGNFGTSLPRFLEPARFEAVRAGMSRITLHQGPIQEAAAAAGGTYSGFNLSDIFEYLDEGLTATVYGALLAHARPGARFAYWNMLVPRVRPARHADAVRSHDELGAALLAADKAFFYSRFVVEEKVA